MVLENLVHLDESGQGAQGTTPAGTAEPGEEDV